MQLLVSLPPRPEGIHCGDVVYTLNLSTKASQLHGLNYSGGGSSMHTCINYNPSGAVYRRVSPEQILRNAYRTTDDQTLTGQEAEDVICREIGKLPPGPNRPLLPSEQPLVSPERLRQNCDR